MSNQAAKQTKGSRWGSLLSGAVANLESRLDTILAEEGTAAARNAQLAKARQAQAEKSSSATDIQTKSLRSPESAPPASIADAPITELKETSNAPAGAVEKEASVRSYSPLPGRTSVDSAAADSQTSTQDLSNRQSIEARSNGGALEHNEPDERHVEDHKQDNATEAASITRGDTPIPDIHVTVASDQETAKAGIETVDELRLQLTQAQSDLDSVQQQRQEETHANMERIDALQAKLQYLAKEALNRAQATSEEAVDGSVEKRLAAKDVQIAELLQEGQKLSKAEVTQSTAVKRLRAKVMEDGRSLSESKRKLSRQENAIQDLRDKNALLETSNREQAQKLSSISRLEQEISDLRRDRELKQSNIESLTRQLNDAAKQAEEEQRKNALAALEAEKKVTDSLREDLANAKIEQKLAEGRIRSELQRAREEAERDRERAKATESGLKNEISVLEGRLEVSRVRSEEVSSGSTNDLQTKLLRQIETLQSQYAQANENWQGIESSLQVRVTALEKERDDISRQESDLRKKARALNTSSRKYQDQYEETSRKCSTLEQEALESQEALERLQARASAFEKELKDAHNSLERERQSWQASLAVRIEQEKSKWRQELPQDSQLSLVTSPTHASRKSSALDTLGISLRKSRTASGEVGNINDRPISRRSSYLPARSPEITSPNGQESGRSTPYFNHIPHPTSSLHATDLDEAEESESSPHRTINDMISQSTAAAGPSVQLVERMSATVRRLESEKAAFKEEQTRLSAQRDEARKEIVSLMKEVQEKRVADRRVVDLEKDVHGMRQRYETTLEMLGEKSERVSELEADVQDLKSMYRDLIESTVEK